MKICLISYDLWNYDHYIVGVLKNKGIEAHHIKLSNYKYPNFFARLSNTFSKIFFNKNIKNIKRQDIILETLRKLGKQDQILVINPECIEDKYHVEIKKFTNRYIAYLYDSLARNPAEKVIPFFDDVFSFDKNDIVRNNFREATNYIYLPHKKTKKSDITHDLIYLGSYDDRIKQLFKIAKKLEINNKKYKFIIIGKKAWKKSLSLSKNFTFSNKKISHSEVQKLYESTAVILDLVREHQNGLSFRFFEAIALEKKIITDNENIKTYDFYNPNNILVLDNNYSNIQKDFFETHYEKLPENIYCKYTLESWVNNIFELN